MGDMADFALDCAFDDCENLEKYRSGICSIHEAFELGIIDEMGVEYPGSGALPIPSKSFVPIRQMKSRGPGLCPRCGKETMLRKGKHGDFYGCTGFPECKGSRNL